MNELSDVTTAVMNRLTAIQSGGADAFRSVMMFSDPDRRRSVAHLRRVVAPAAMVVYAGRGRGAGDEGVLGMPKLSVLVSARNLRGGDDPQVGDAAVNGAFELLSLVAGDLDGAIVDADRRLIAVDEQLVGADESQVVYEQRYVVERVNNVTLPTWNADTLVGAGSVVDVVVGDVSTESSQFAFPGVDGVFEHHLGVRSREIVWRGQLRAVDDATLNTVEAGIETAIGGATSADLTDAFSRTFGDCVPRRFTRRGKRRRDPVSGEAVQPFEMLFVQLNP